MNEGAPVSPHEQGPDTAEQVRGAIKRFEALEASVPEAEDILFRGERPRFREELVMGGGELKAGACVQEAEAHADRGEYTAERAERMLEQLVQYENGIQGLYYDALSRKDLEDLAAFIKKRHGTVAANDDVFQQNEAA